MSQLPSFEQYRLEVRRSTLLLAGSLADAYDLLADEVAFHRLMADIDRQHDDRVYREALAASKQDDTEGRLARRESPTFKAENCHE